MITTCCQSDALPDTLSICPPLPSSLTILPRDCQWVIRAPFLLGFLGGGSRDLHIKLNTLLIFLPFPFAEECDDKQPLTTKEEEERRIAEMGRPILGEHTKLEVIIEESYEFKVRSPTLPTGRPGPSWDQDSSQCKILHCKIHLGRDPDVISGTGQLAERLSGKNWT